MPIPADVTLDELIAAMLKQDRAVVLQNLQEKAQPLYQGIFDKGHAAATAKFTTEKATLEGKVAGLESDVRARDIKIAELSEKAPEVAALQTKHDGAVQALKDQHKQELEKAKQTLIAERKSRVKSDIQRELVVTGKVDADYAEMLLNKPEFDARLKPNADGAIEIFKADSETAYVPAKGKTVIHLAAVDLLPSVPKKFINIQTDSGSGTNRGDGSGAGEGGGSRYDAIREEAKAAHQKPEGQTSARERLAGAGRRK